MLEIMRTGESVTVDETDGLQNYLETPLVSEDANDNDIDVPTVAPLPVNFAGRLMAVEGEGYTNWLNVALSGYGLPGDTGAPGEDIISVSDGDGEIMGLSFSSSANGAPFPVLGSSAYGIDSGLESGGNKVLLYLDPDDNNVLYGVANGEIVFALYLEETVELGVITGAKMWTVLYKPLDHTDGTNPDDSLNLTDKVFVSVESQQEFDLAGVPSGQNLFLMWKSITSSDAIVATGINPANTSDGQVLSVYETVNTGQGGGNTTLSNTSQSGLVAYTGYGTSLVYTFVDETNWDFTVPQASPTEVDFEHNIEFAVVMKRATILGNPDALSGTFTIQVADHPTITFVAGTDGSTLQDLIDFVGQIEVQGGYVELEVQGNELVVKTFGDTVALSGFNDLAPALNGTFTDDGAEAAGVEAKGVGFTVVQVGGGEEATVKITLIDRSDIRTGEDYVDGVKKITTVASTDSGGTLKLGTALTRNDVYRINVDFNGDGATTSDTAFTYTVRRGDRKSVV